MLDFEADTVLTVGAHRVRAVLGVHSAFPSHVTLPDGRLLMVYRESRTEQPVHLDGVIRSSCSDDGGRTWTEPATIFTDALDLRDPNVSSIDGRLYLTCFKHDGAQPVGVFLSTSDDDGATWAPLVRIDCPSNERAAVCAPVVKIGEYLHVPWYGKKSLTEPFDSAYVLRSTDGITWTQHTIAAGVSKDYQEPNITPVAGGMVALFRNGNADSLGRAHSAAGEAWGMVEKVISDASGKAALLSLPDMLLVVYRRVSDGKPIVRASRDGGVSWGSQTVLDNEPAYAMAYACLTESAPGVIAVTYSLERSMGSLTVDGAAQLYVRYLFVRSGRSPLGDIALSAPYAITKVPVVYDSFERPDTATEVGVSDSGHAWRSSGVGITVGSLYTAAPGVCAATVDAGVANGEIKARFTFCGGGGVGLIVRAASDSTYLMFVHDSDGRYARLYKAVSGSVTLLAGAADDTRNAVTTYSPYELAVKANGRMIRCYVDGHEVLAHVLSTADAALFGANTRHGVRMNRVGNSHMVHEFTVT